MRFGGLWVSNSSAISFPSASSRRRFPREEEREPSWSDSLSSFSSSSSLSSKSFRCRSRQCKSSSSVSPSSSSESLSGSYWKAKQKSRSNFYLRFYMKRSKLYLKSFKSSFFLFHILFNISIVPNNNLFRLWCCREKIIEVTWSM